MISRYLELYSYRCNPQFVTRIQAQEDANLLKSVVLPLEAEIATLKEKLSTTQQILQKYEPDFEVRHRL